MRYHFFVILLLLLPSTAHAQVKKIGHAVKKAAVFVYTHPPGEHDWEAGLDRVPLHLAGFGVPAFAAEHYMPERWAITTAVALAAWRGWAEHRDHVQHLDTSAKAWIDWSSQITGGIVGASTWRRK